MMTSRRIFDFDQTMSVCHSFGTRCIEACLSMSMGAYSIFLQGHKDASGFKAKDEHNKEYDVPANLKKEVSTFLELSEDNLFAIATYHNNPHYIAGYIAKAKGIDPTKCQSIVDNARTIYNNEEKSIAINIYNFGLGLGKEIYICHIPKQNDDFQKTKGLLTGKNEMIQFIVKTWREAGVFKENTVIDYYDDDKKNIEKAKGTLPNVNAYLVEAANPSFKFTLANPKEEKTETLQRTFQPARYAADTVGLFATSAVEQEDPTKLTISELLEKGGEPRTFKNLEGQFLFYLDEKIFFILAEKLKSDRGFEEGRDYRADKPPLLEIVPGGCIEIKDGKAIVNPKKVITPTNGS